MLEPLLRFYRTRPDRPTLEDAATVERTYERFRWSVFFSTLIGYGFFYTCRLSLSVTKQPMLDAGVLDSQQMGQVGFGLLAVYALGKATNGFLADRANIARFMSTGLLVSAVVNILFGLNSSFWTFVLLWAINGWFQSIGSAPSVVSLCQWFSNRERGTRYGIWAASHSIGEGITFVGTAALVSWVGWRWGFLGPGIFCLGLALLLFRTLKDRPQTYGLPHVADYRNDHSAGKPSERSVGSLQLEVIKSPIVWVLGLSSASMYMARYALNNWGVLYLQKVKGYTLIDAGAILGAYPVAGLFGASLCGVISDRFFGSRRNLPTLLYGLLLVASMATLFFGPQARWIDIAAMAGFGFAIGGLIVFLAGLTALDSFSKKAAGAVKGVLGLFSYIGAAIQDWVSGALIHAGRSEIAGQMSYDFGPVIVFWMAAALAAVLLPLLVWNVKPRE